MPPPENPRDRADDPSPAGFWCVRTAAGLIALATLAAYAGTFAGEFILDDLASITRNPSIRHLWPLGPVLHPPSGLGVGARPVLNLSFALNYALSGRQVWSYHAFNLAIHVAASLALFGVVRRTLLREDGGRRSRSLSLALAAALLWAVHPALTESVTYVSQRAESLMGLAYLLTLYCFIRSLPETEGDGRPGGRKAAWAALAVLACGLGMATKEVMVTAPLTVLLYDRAFAGGGFGEALRRRRWLYPALAATWLIPALLMRNLAARGVGFGIGISGLHYARLECTAVVRYLALALWPHPLVFDYGPEAGAGSSLPVNAALLLLLAGSALAAFRRNPRAGFAGVCFFLILAPSSSFVPVALQPIAENRLYVPLACLAALATLGLDALLGRRLWLAAAPLILVLGLLTVLRNQDYRTQLGLWKITVEECPDNYRARNNYGNALLEAGRPAEALPQYLEALRLAPGFGEAVNNIGITLVRQGKTAQAITRFREALRLLPSFAEADFNLGNALVQVGQVPDAIAEYRKAIGIDPDMEPAYLSLGVALQLQPGGAKEAIDHFRTALAINPADAQAHHLLGSALANTPGDMSEAIEQFGAALRLEPTLTAARVDLGMALVAMPGRLPDAVDAFSEAIRIDPASVEAHYNLGNALAQLHRLPEAVAEYQRVVELNPGYPDGHNNLGAALAAVGRTSEAITEYRSLVRLTPGDAKVHYNLGTLLAAQPGGTPEARAQFKETLRLNPGFKLAQKALDRLPRAAPALHETPPPK